MSIEKDENLKLRISELKENLQKKNADTRKQRKYAANARSEKKNTRRYVIKLSFGTDGDIIKKLESLDNKQGYIKDLIRADLKNGVEKP